MKKYIYIILALYLLNFIACERYIESRDPVYSLPNDVPIPNNLNMYVDNLSVTLTWEISNASSISKYRVYVSENDSLNYKLEDSTSLMTITLDNLTTNRLYFYKVAAVNTTGLEGNRSDELFAQVGILSMIINNNTPLTNREAVQVQFTVSNSVSNVQLSEDSTFTGVVFEQFSSQRSFTLSNGDGMKTVYARLLFTIGATNKILLQDSILLDTKARIDSVFFLFPDSLYHPGDTIVFALMTGEIGGSARASFTGAGDISLVDDGTDFDQVADDGNYYGWYVVPNNTNVHNVTVTGNFIDEAGNNAPPVNSYDPLNINTRPEPITLIVSYTGVSGDSAIFNWTRSDEPDFESYRLYTADNSNVLTDDELLIYESNVNTRRYAIIPKPGTTYYRIFVFDVHGVSRASENYIRIINP